jgi:hypothetical protein
MSFFVANAHHEPGQSIFDQVNVLFIVFVLETILIHLLKSVTKKGVPKPLKVRTRTKIAW